MTEEKKKEKSLIDTIFGIKTRDEEKEEEAKKKLDQAVEDQIKGKVVANIRGTKIYSKK